MAGGISTCHEQIHLIREQGLTFFCISGRLNCGVCVLGVEEEGAVCWVWKMGDGNPSKNGKGGEKEKKTQGWVCCAPAGGNP